MKEIKQDQLTADQHYRLLSDTVTPRPITMVSSLNEAGGLNLAPFSFFNVVSSQPPILSLAVQREDGQSKDTAVNILREKEAVFHLVHDEIMGDVFQTAQRLAPLESELDLTSFSLAESTEIKTPRIAQVKTSFETKLSQHVQVGETDLLLMEVVAYHVDDTVFEAAPGQLKEDWQSLEDLLS